MGGGISSPSIQHSDSKSFQLPPCRSSRVASFITSTPKLSNYYIGAVVGKGGFGKIHEIRRKKDDRWFALKTFELKTMILKDAESIVAELLALHRIPSHPFIIQLYAAFRERSSISFVMDLLVGGDLRLLMRLGEKFTENKIAYLIACVGSALHHIHCHHIIHRDIKPENIMFTSNGLPKLIDFGISCLLPTNSQASYCQLRSGTKQYISPEALVNETHYHGYESDFWSLGIIMYELLYLQRPYETNPPIELVNYSERTYKTTWKTIRSLAINDPHRDEFNYSHSLTTTATSTPSMITANEFSFSVSASTITNPLATGFLQYFPIDEEDAPLPEELLIPLPQLSALQELPSESCLSLLSSLLDVRIQKRLGVGENYHHFIRHPFFASQQIDVVNVLTYPSPIHPNMDQIGLHLWNQFFAMNLDDSDPLPLDPTPSQGESSPSSPNSSCCCPNKDVEDYLQTIQASTPLFYETTENMIKRDPKLVNSSNEPRFLST